jgi:hypothetical protein
MLRERRRWTDGAGAILWDAAWRTRTVSKLAGSLAAYAGLAVVNAKILKHGFKFENGGLVPVNAAGEIPN